MLELTVGHKLGEGVFASGGSRGKRDAAKCATMNKAGSLFQEVAKYSAIRLYG